MRAKSTTQGESEPLDREAWAAAGLQQLAAKGVDGVRVEPLAAKMKVTRGSFYWHFKDREDLLGAILELWRRETTYDLIRRIESTDNPADRLRRLLRSPWVGKKVVRAARIELTIRLWGATDDRARAVLEEVDRLRLQHMTNLLIAYGISAEDAETRAIVAYSYIRVGPSLVDDEEEVKLKRCEEFILSLK